MASNYFDYNDPVKIEWRDELVDKINEQWKIIGNKIFLDEIPDESEHVKIQGYTELYQRYSPQQLTPNSKQFIVNYQNGEVTFNTSENGKTVTVTKYKGRGFILYPAKRIYLETENPNFYKRLQEFVDETEVAIVEIGSIKDIVKDGKVLEVELSEDIKVGTALNQSLNTSITTANQRKTALDGSIASANTTKKQS